MNDSDSKRQLHLSVAPSLAIRRATKRFGQTIALRDVSLDVASGQFVVLLGPSGSGKSTLLRSVAGIERISEGEIQIGDDIVDDGRRQLPPERRDLAMVFQDYALWPHLTARDNVAFALRRRRLDARVVRQQVHRTLERVGLGALGDRYPSELSGGEQQRVSLARALVARPGLLLFDEPLSNLDAGLREQLRLEIATLVREAATTTIYITHDQSEAFALADRIGVLERGRLVQYATPEDIYRSPLTPFVAQLTGLAGELGGHVLTRPQNDHVVVALGDGQVVARAQDPVEIGDPVRVLIRPSAVRLLSSDGTGGQLRGEVRDAAFCGRGYEHLVELRTGERLAAVFDPNSWGRGAPVGVSFDPDGCLLYQYPDARLGDTARTEKILVAQANGALVPRGAS